MFFKKRTQNIIGIDIGSNMIKMVEVSVKGTPKPVKWACEKNLSGSAASSRDADKKLAKKLKVCLKRLRPSTRIASLCLTDPSVVLKELILPSMGEKEILENLRFELSEYYSTDFKDHRLSYRLIGESDGKDNITVLAAAAPLELLNKYSSIIRASGMKLKYIDIPVNCSSKLIAKMIKDDGLKGNPSPIECLCIVDCGEKNIDISIFEGGNLCLNRAIAAQEPGYDEAALLEIAQVIDYFNRKDYEKKVARIILTGGRSYTDGLAEYIAKQLPLPVEVARPDMFAAFGDINADFPMALYFKALGSAIREE